MTPRKDPPRADPRGWLAAHVEHQGDECLPWPFCCDGRQGYPTLLFDDKTERAHRVMCQLAHGPPPTEKHRATWTCGGLRVRCVNPRHLGWRTDSEIQKAANDRRRAAGTYRPVRWKLRREQVERIREMKGRKNSYAVAAFFGIDRQTVRTIWYGRPHYKSPERDRVYGALEAAAATMSISQIRKATGASHCSVNNVLRKLVGEGDVVRVRRGRYRVPLTARMMRKVTAAVRGAVPPAMPRQMRDEVVQEVFLAIVEGTASLLDLRAEVAEATRKYHRTYPAKFGPRSLDAPLRGGEGLTLLDVLPAAEDSPEELHP